MPRDSRDAPLDVPISNATDIQKHEITSYLDPIAIGDQEEGTKKANRQLRSLKACFNWGWQEGLLGKGAENPCRGIPDYTEERYEPRIPPMNIRRWCT